MKRKRRTRLLRALLLTIIKKNKDFTDNMMEAAKEILPKKMEGHRKAEIMLQLWDDFEGLMGQINDDMFVNPQKTKNFNHKISLTSE